MFNEVILIGRLGQNAEAKTAQNNNEFVVLNIATQESWKNDKGEYETRTEWHRVYAWRNLSKFAKTLQKVNSSPWKALCGIATTRKKWTG
jgi:single-strand DNA-binding protein